MHKIYFILQTSLILWKRRLYWVNTDPFPVFFFFFLWTSNACWPNMNQRKYRNPIATFWHKSWELGNLLEDARIWKSSVTSKHFIFLDFYQDLDADSEFSYLLDAMSVDLYGHVYQVYYNVYTVFIYFSFFFNANLLLTCKR